jgi:hypothetical protein
LIAKWPEGNKPIAFIENGHHRICLIQSNKFGGHVLHEHLGSNKPTIYLGTCEEFYKGVQDAMYTEMRYAQRTREKVINGKRAKFYSEGQIQIALDFVKASDDAKNEWLAVLNKFVATCGAMDIGLLVGGRQPQDLVPKSLQYK